MRYIKIATQMMPFTHTYGSSVLIPGTSFAVCAYPTKVIITSLICEKTWEFLIPLHGPITNFALIQDIEKKQLRLSGQYREGHALFIIEGKEKIHFFAKKGPPVLKGFSHEIPLEDVVSIKNTAKLDLGISKQQDLDLVRKRCDPREFLPLLFALSSLYESTDDIEDIPLLRHLKQAIEKKDKIEISDLLKKIYLAHFSKGIVPRLTDDEYQGILDHDITFERDAIKILKGLRPLIMSMFCVKKQNRLILLPALSKEFASGRGIHFQLDNMSVSFIWKGKELQRLMIENRVEQELIIESKQVEEFRYRSKFHPADKPIFLLKGIHSFDRFIR